MEVIKRSGEVVELSLIHIQMCIRDRITFTYPETKQVMLDWSKDQDFWLRRIAIDHQLMRKEKTDTDLLEKVILNNLGQNEFFINKAIGWSLRNYSKVNPDWVGRCV